MIEENKSFFSDWLTKSVCPVGRIGLSIGTKSKKLTCTFIMICTKATLTGLRIIIFRFFLTKLSCLSFFSIFLTTDGQILILFSSGSEKQLRRCTRESKFTRISFYEKMSSASKKIFLYIQKKF